MRNAAARHESPGRGFSRRIQSVRPCRPGHGSAQEGVWRARRQISEIRKHFVPTENPVESSRPAILDPSVRRFSDADRWPTEVPAPVPSKGSAELLPATKELRGN